MRPGNVSVIVIANENESARENVRGTGRESEIHANLNASSARESRILVLVSLLYPSPHPLSPTHHLPSYYLLLPLHHHLPFLRTAQTRSRLIFSHRTRIILPNPSPWAPRPLRALRQMRVTQMPRRRRARLRARGQRPSCRLLREEQWVLVWDMRRGMDRTDKGRGRSR